MFDISLGKFMSLFTSKRLGPYLLYGLLVVMAFAIGGYLLMRPSGAATVAISKEAESGTPAGSASPVADPGASGGSAVQFQSGSAPPPVTPPTPTPTPTPAGWNPPAVKRDLGFDPACNFSQWDEVLNNELGTVDIVRSPVVAGSCAAEFKQDANTTGSWRRVELQNHRPENGAAAGEGSEAWYQFKVYLISAGSPTQSNVKGYAINQFRTSAVSCYTGGIDVTNDKRFRFLVRGGSFSAGSGCNFPAGKDIDMGAAAFNQWYTLQFHYVWSSKTNGRAEVWLDGKKVVDHTGPTSAVGAGNIMFRNGIYSGPHSGTISFVIDDVKIYR